jgi:hypothetical protein
MLLPKVASIGMPVKISDGMATGLLHKLHDMRSELTALPTGVRVDSTEMSALVTEGKVPVANPIIELKVAEEVLNVIVGVVATAGYPANELGAVNPDGNDVGTV